MLGILIEKKCFRVWSQPKGSGREEGGEGELLGEDAEAGDRADAAEGELEGLLGFALHVRADEQLEEGAEAAEGSRVPPGGLLVGEGYDS